MKFLHSVATDPGNRPYQEDRVSIGNIMLPSSVTGGRGLLLAVADGHGGSSNTAEYIAGIVQSEFFSALQATAGNVRKGFRKLCKRLHALTQSHSSGSTFSAVYLPEDELFAYVCVLGDSPVVIKTARGRLWVSPEHNVRSNSRELKAAEMRGGRCIMGYLYGNLSDRGIQLSRSFGDQALEDVLSRTPQVFKVPLGEQSFVLLASDGVMDPTHNNGKEAFKRICSIIEGGGDAQSLVDDALVRHTMDNVTAILCKINAPAAKAL